MKRLIQSAMAEPVKQRDCDFRARWELKGAHIHVDLFLRYKGQETWQNSGHIVVGEDQFFSLAENWPNTDFEERKANG